MNYELVEDGLDTTSSSEVLEWTPSAQRVQCVADKPLEMPSVFVPPQWVQRGYLFHPTVFSDGVEPASDADVDWLIYTGATHQPLRRYVCVRADFSSDGLSDQSWAEEDASSGTSLSGEELVPHDELAALLLADPPVRRWRVPCRARCGDGAP